MSSAPIRTAVIGYGLGGRVFHCPFVSAVPGLELTAIVQRKGDEAHNAYPDAKILRSVDEAFADPNIDLIVVSTPNETHLDLARRALQAGKHVVIDKPFAPSSESALELIALAKSKGVVLAPFHNRRFDGDFFTLRKVLDDKILGRVVQIISRFDRFRPIQRPNTWKEESGASNGLLFDLGPHLIDQAVGLFGAPDTITASVRRQRDTTDIDDAFDIVLEYKALKLRYECGSTMVAAEPAPRFTAHGTLGSFIKHGVDPQEPAILAGARPPRIGSDEPWYPEAESAWGHTTIAPDPNDPAKLDRKKVATIPGDYRLFYENICDAISGIAPLEISAKDGYVSMKLIELALQSSREGRTLTTDLEI